MLKIITICTGNICRSPVAQALLKREFRQAGYVVCENGSSNSVDCDVFIDSAGTGGWHVGHGADDRSVRVCLENDIDISSHIARQFSAEEAEVFDHIFVMDRDNLLFLQGIIDKKYHHKISMFSQDGEIKDPYYGGIDGFKKMFLQIQQSAKYIVKDCDL